MRSKRSDAGQAVLLVVASISVFLFGAVGLAIDGSQLYAQRQMAQSVADAAAQAGIMSILNGSTAIGTNSYSCTPSNTTSPCWYAQQNGFGTTTGAGSDTIQVEPNPAGITVNNSSSVLEVTITRPVSMTLTRMIGLSSFNVKASAVAAIVNISSPVPIVITDPNNPNTLSMNGTTSIVICGGPSRSIQVNSSSIAGGYRSGGSVDLSHAGPADPGNCTSGTGADFGTSGGPRTVPGSITLGTAGHYVQPASSISDPLAGVAAPAVPGFPATGIKGQTISGGTDGCTSASCLEFSPGLYAGGINLKNKDVIFKPGVYYMQGGGFTLKNVNGGNGGLLFNGVPSGMCVGCAADADTGAGMVVYDTGPAGSTAGHNAAGGFTMSTGTNIFLAGSTLTTTNPAGNTVPAAPYYNILFFEDRTADANSHNLGQGNASFAWQGTIYITNTLAIMQDTSDPVYPNHVQSVTYNGGPNGTTSQMGNFIVGQLSMVGNSTFKMQLIPYGYLNTNQVALVQ